MVKKCYVNDTRTKEQRRVRYCFLRHLGCNRNLARSIVGRSDSKIVQTIENIGQKIC